MNPMRFGYFSILLLCSSLVCAQSSITVSLESTTNFYIRDSLIGATGTPQYDNQLSGTDAWLSLQYNNYDWGLTGGLRFDLFNNSNLHNPSSSYTGIGLGRWFVSKEINKLTITGGYIYEQFGSGITFRAYEERPLAIDNALYGIHLKYQVADNWNVRAMTGKQKNIFSTFNPIIKGAITEGFHAFNSDFSVSPGASIMNRTIDQKSMDLIVSNIESMPVADRFVPKYNVYAWSVFNRLNYKSLSWYLEYAGKSSEAILNSDGNLINKPGSVLYTTLTYATKGLGVTLQFKKTDHYTLRTSPNETLLKGVLNFLPPMSRQNTYQLTTRYNSSTQDLGENALQADFLYTPVKGISITGNFSNITNLENDLLYREIYLDILYKRSRKWKATAGIQLQDYNQIVYEQKGDSLLHAITPFLEFTYKLNKKKSLRTELQYMSNKKDFGSWVFGLLELTIAPNFSFAISDLYNIDPKKTTDDLHYYSIFGAYINKANRFTLAYVKQVEGVVCTGGVCRYEPAFSGVKFTISSTF